jgi:hypothetical protein
VIKRKHWLIEPDDEKWPLVVKDTFKMEVCSDQSHRLVPEPDYEQKLRILSRIIITHDIDALYQFVQLNPFNPHGLIQLSTILIGQRSEFETAYQLIRRALFAFQSAFIPSFHPSKSVALSTDSIFSSTLLRALLLYSQLLAGQGCSRTSLEIMKLIYAMEGGMTSGSPITHILLHIDSMAIRSGEYDWYSKFVTENHLYDVFPGHAIQFAIAQKNREIDEARTVTRPELIGRMSQETPATVALIRAALTFPQTVREIVGRDVDGIERKVEPFTNKLIQAWISKGSPSAIKANEKIFNWIQSVLVSLNELLPSNICTLKHRQPEWLLGGYQNITSAEFSWGSGYVEPSPILESEAQILEIYADEGYTAPAPGLDRMAPRLTHAVSLESNPIAAFFQTLLPWSTVDVHGTEATPITAAGMLQQLRAGLGLERIDPEPLIQDADGISGEDSPESHSESAQSEDEIVME